MDQAVLVIYRRIDEGKAVVEALCRTKLDVSAAFWMYTNDDEKWFLYIVTKTNSSNAGVNPYKFVIDAFPDSPEMFMTPEHVKLVDIRRPLAKWMVKYVARLPDDDTPGRLSGGEPDGPYIESAYVYPRSVIRRPEPSPTPA